MKIQSFETGLNDYHHMTYTNLKIKCEKLEPKKMIYYDFKNFKIRQLK